MKRLFEIRSLVLGVIGLELVALSSCALTAPGGTGDTESVAADSLVVANANLKYFGPAIIGVTADAGITEDDRLKEVRTFSNVGHVAVMSSNHLIGPRLRQLRSENMKAIIDVSQLFFENAGTTWSHCAFPGSAFPNQRPKLRTTGAPADVEWRAFVANNNLTNPDVKAGILAFTISDEPGLHGISMNDLDALSLYIKSTLNHTTSAPVRTMYVESGVILYHPKENGSSVTVFGNPSWENGKCNSTYDQYLTPGTTPANVDFPSVDIYYLDGTDVGGTKPLDPIQMELALNRFKTALRPGQQMFVIGQADHDSSFGTNLSQADTRLRDHNKRLFELASAATSTNVVGYMTYHWGADGLDVVSNDVVTDFHCLGTGHVLPSGVFALPLTRLQHFEQGAAVLPNGVKTIFDFTSSMPTGTAFSRATAGTYYGADGVMHRADVNEPRLEYGMGKALGLLLEPAATNLLCKSEALNATGSPTTCNWKHENVAVGDNFTTPLDPTNNPTVEGIVEEVNMMPLTHGIYQNVNLAASRKYVFSVFVKPASRNQVSLVSTNKAGLSQTAMFNLTGNGGIVPGGAAAAGIVKYGSWYRVMLAFDSGTGTTQPSVRLNLVSGSQSSYPGTASGLYAWGAQLELGASTNVFPNPTSYIKTDTAAATRSADSLNLVPTFASMARGTFSVEIADIVAPSVDDSIGSTLLHFDDLNTTTGTTKNAWDVKVTQAKTVNLSVVQDLTGNTPEVLANQTSTNELTAGYQAKFVFAYSGSNPSEIVSGLGTAAAEGFVPTQETQTDTLSGNWTRMLVGRDGSGAARFTGHIRTIRYFPYNVHAGGANGKLQDFVYLSLIAD